VPQIAAFARRPTKRLNKILITGRSARSFESGSLKDLETDPMPTKVISIERLRRLTRRSSPYIRALADSGAIDSYITDSGWRCFPEHAAEQLKRHEAERKKLLAT
jgi:hypothetical protein